MRKAFVVLLAILMIPALAGAATIEKITGSGDGPEKAYDNNLKTAATFKNSPGKDYSDIFIYLNEEAYPEEITLFLQEDIANISSAVSSDIVNWTEMAMIVEKYDEKDGMKRVVLTILDREGGKYLRLRIGGGKDGKISIKEIKCEFGDEQPNEVSDVVAKALDDNSMEITYKTEYPTKTHIRYGAEGPAFDKAFLLKEHVTAHRAVIKKLLSGTDYYYQIVVGKDDETGAVYSFRTSGEPLPIVNKVFVNAPTFDSVSIDLGANKPVKWKVFWNRYEKDLPAKIDEKTAKVEILNQPVVEATMDLKNLTPRKKYFIQVEIEDEKGKKALSDVLGFQAAEKNLAVGGMVSGTFTNEKKDDKYIQKTTNPMGRVTDGDENYHTGFAKSQKPTKEAQWVMVDLGGKKKIAEVVIVWSDLAVPMEYVVSTSLNRMKKTTILDVKNGKYPQGVKVRERQSPRGDPLYEIRINVNETIQFIHLEIPRNAKIRSRFDWDYAMLAEIKALEPEQD